jgi:starch phosphorylase
MVTPLLTFPITPALPPRLERLRDLASNLRWAWDHDTVALFRRLDADLWEASGHNPVRMLGTVDQAALDAAAADDGFLAQFDRAVAGLDAYMSRESTYVGRTGGTASSLLVAYF